MSIEGPINLAVLAGARIPHPVVPHSCVGGPVWSAVAQPLGNYLYVTYGGGRFVATGQGQAGSTPTSTMYSLDKGQSWVAGGSIPNFNQFTPLSLRYNKATGRFLAYLGGTGSTYTDDGGLTWTIANAGHGYFSLSVVEVGNGLFVYLPGTITGLAASASGLGVTFHATPAIFSRCFWDAPRNRWLGLESGGVRCWTSPDLVTWTQRGNMPQDGAVISSTDMAQATFGPYNGRIVCAYAVSDTVSYTDDGGDTWVQSGLIPTSNQVECIIFGNGIFILAKSLGGATNISNDGGATWTIGNFLTMTKVWHLAYNGLNNYSAVGNLGGSDTVANVGVC